MKESGKKVEAILKEFRFGPNEPKLKSSELTEVVKKIYGKNLDSVLVLEDETEDEFRRKIISELNNTGDKKKRYDDLDAYLYIFQYTNESDQSFLAIRN